MALRVNHIVSSGSNVDFSARLRAYSAVVTANAEQGSVAISQIVIDDPEGGIGITGLRPFSLTETAESSNQQVIYNGWTADREVTRGESFRTGSARKWTVNVADGNSIITRRIMRGADANRPAETDVARVQWLLTTSEFGDIVTTSRYVSTLFPVAMDAVDYRDQNNQQIIDDCSQASGKNYWIIYDENTSPASWGLVYDFVGSSKYRSALRLTNILGYVDNDITFGVSESDTKLNRDPSRVYSGVVLPYVGGEVYVSSNPIATAFQVRDTTAPAYNVKSSAKATARANRYIADAATEADVITTSFLVPLAKVNHLREGQQVQCWFAHFPGYDTGWNWMRVLRRTVTATSEEYYTIEVEMAAAIGGLDAGGGRTSEGVVIPAPPIVEATPLQTCVAQNMLTYSYTAKGTRSALGLVLDVPTGNYHATSTTFMGYCTSSGCNGEYPNAGADGNWGDGGVGLCTFPSGGTDYTAGGIVVWINFTVIGPGSLSIQTTPNAKCIDPKTVTASAYRSGSTTLVDSDAQMVGTTLNITIPDDGYCAHYIQVGSPGTWGFVSATWS
jgi:hypothetical protein